MDRMEARVSGAADDDDNVVVSPALPAVPIGGVATAVAEGPVETASGPVAVGPPVIESALAAPPVVDAVVSAVLSGGAAVDAEEEGSGAKLPQAG